MVQDEGVKHHPGQGSRLPLSRQTPCVPPRTAWLLQARSPCPRPQHWGGGRGGEYVSFFKDRTQELDLSPPLEPVGRSRGRTQPQGTVKRRVAGWASVPGSSSVPREGGVGGGTPSASALGHLLTATNHSCGRSLRPFLSQKLKGISTNLSQEFAVVGSGCVTTCHKAA